MNKKYKFSAPGRIEVSGNHTDHQRGCVLAAAVNADITCEAVHSDLIELKMDGYGDIAVNPASADSAEYEKGTPLSLILGVLDYFSKNKYKTGGFRATVHSNVREGSGLSSSAAFTNLIGTALNHMFNNGEIPPIQIAKAGQHAENNFFGKPSGLMDQAASALGGFVFIDFGHDEPLTESIKFNPSAHGLTVCVVHTGGSHADLTDEYASIPRDMRSVANILGKDVLGFCNPNDFYNKIYEIRQKVSDRAVLRAFHFFNETKRVKEQANMLKNGDLEGFLRLVNESGWSSVSCLQNIYTNKLPETQPISLALALTEQILEGRGACRVHGGGFAGTILAFVPNDLFEKFEKTLNSIFGENAVHTVEIRDAGVICIPNES